MTIDTLKLALTADLAQVDHALRSSLDSDVALIRQVAEYIIAGGGERLRPALLGPSGRAWDNRGRDDPHGDAAA